MARSALDVTNKELEVLQALWDEGPCTIRQLTDLLYPGGGTSKYATVQKLLDRLEEDDCVGRDRARTPHVFVARIAREDLIGRRLEDMAEKLCGGSLTPLLTHLVKAQRLSAKERNELRALIDELDVRRKPENNRR